MIGTKFNQLPLLLLIIAILATLTYILWLDSRPVEIVDVHQRNDYSDVLVKGFPFSDKGKINWWLKNKEMLKNRYGVPKPDKDGDFTIIFWDFGEGYKERDKYEDRLCFDDMNTKENCIEKENFFFVNHSRNFGIIFTGDSGYYQLRKNGKLRKFYYESIH